MLQGYSLSPLLFFRYMARGEAETPCWDYCFSLSPGDAFEIQLSAMGSWIQFDCWGLMPPAHRSNRQHKPAPFAFAIYRRAPLAPKHCFLGPSANTACIWDVWPTWSPMSVTCVAPRAVPAGLLGGRRRFKLLAKPSKSTRLPRPLTTTPPPASTAMLQRLSLHRVFWLFAARTSSSPTPIALPGTKPGRSCPTVTSTGPWFSTDNPTNGLLNGSASAAMPPPLLQGLPPDGDRPVCPTHGPRCLALDLREGSRGWICSRGAQVLPCRTVRIPLPPANPEPGPAANAPPDADFAWFRRGPPPPGALPGPTHSWIFVPLLHAAVGRLHSDALQAWETNPHYGALWSRALANLRLAGSVPPASVVHALHILQQLSSEEGRPVPLPEAQLLLNISGGASTLPANASVHLLWAWSFAVQPDGYILATAQEALLHVFLAEAAASELVQQASAPAAATSTDTPAPAVHPPEPPAQRPGSASSSSASSSFSSPFAAVGPVPRQRHPSKRTCAAPGPCFRPRADPA